MTDAIGSCASVDLTIMARRNSSTLFLCLVHALLIACASDASDSYDDTPGGGSADAGILLPEASPTEEAEPARTLEIGEACAPSLGQVCSPGLACVKEPCTSWEEGCQTCRPVANCWAPNPCPDGELCVEEYPACVPVAKAGQPCVGLCEEGFVCHPSFGNSAPPRCVGPGSPCARAVDCPHGFWCGDGDVCVPESAAGEACWGSWECADGLFCGPNERCEPLREEGQDCVANGYSTSDGFHYNSDYCAPGLTCKPRVGHQGCFVSLLCGGASQCCVAQDDPLQGVCLDAFACSPPKGTCRAQDE